MIDHDDDYRLPAPAGEMVTLPTVRDVDVTRQARQPALFAQP